jgi:hypothetical protein
VKQAITLSRFDWLLYITQPATITPKVASGGDARTSAKAERPFSLREKFRDFARAKTRGFPQDFQPCWAEDGFPEDAVSGELVS